MAKSKAELNGFCQAILSISHTLNRVTQFQLKRIRNAKPKISVVSSVWILQEGWDGPYKINIQKSSHELGIQVLVIEVKQRSQPNLGISFLLSCAII